jgi:hypothetical protein
VSYCVFVGFWLALWVAILALLKFRCGNERVGCAAGGGPVDIAALKKHHRLSRRERKDRILRNWRVQTVCLLCCGAMLIASILLVQLGLEPFIASLEDLQSINDSVDSRAYRGIQIVAELQKAHSYLAGIQNSSDLRVATTIQTICPQPFLDAIIFRKNATAANATATTLDNATAASNGTVAASHPTMNITAGFDVNVLLDLANSSIYQKVVDGFNQLDAFVKAYDLNTASEALVQVTGMTESVDMGADWLYRNDWTLKMMVLVMDVLLVFFLVGILSTKHSLDWPAYHRVATWLLVPAFAAVLVGIFLAMFLFLALAVINAGTCLIFYCYFSLRIVALPFGGVQPHTRILAFSDFCVGNREIASPLGTLNQMVIDNGFNATSLPHQVLAFYESVSVCLFACSTALAPQVPLSNRPSHRFT